MSVVLGVGGVVLTTAVFVVFALLFSFDRYMRAQSAED
jgi:hypothetical protein